MERVRAPWGRMGAVDGETSAMDRPRSVQARRASCEGHAGWRGGKYPELDSLDFSVASLVSIHST